MSRRGRRGLAGLFAVLLLVPAALVSLPSARADDISDKQAQHDQLQGLINQLQGQIGATQNKEAQLNDIIAGLNAEITQTQQAITEAKAQLERIRAALADAERRLAEAKARLAADREELAKEMRLVYETENQSTPINNLLASGDFNEFWQRLLDLRRLSQKMRALVDAVHREQDAIQQTVDEIAAEKVQQQHLISQLNAAAAALGQQLLARQAALAVLAGVEAQDQAQLAAAEAAQRQVDDEISALKAERAAAEAAARRAAGRAPGGATSGGHGAHFAWPEDGPITQGFGCTEYQFEPYDPNCPSRHFHSGIDIAADGGTPIGAAAGGIAHTYWSGFGYGNHIIIDHGDGWVSLYGHMSGFTVGDGEDVWTGKTIGFEGSTGNSTGPHLHFEIRFNDEPRNPLDYLP